jgi:hypothetical protein
MMMNDTNIKSDLPFDEKHFEKLKKEGIQLTIDEVFKKIHQENHWGDGESVSGQGSNAEQTATISLRIPELLKELKIQRLLDAPCGDFGWISKIDLPIKQYIGADIVPEVIAKHQERITKQINTEEIKANYLTDYKFVVLDITQDELPEADLMLCRDCLVHLSFDDIRRFVQNLKKSNIKYLLTTTFPERIVNQDIATGDWRTLNLQIAPFSFPVPLMTINENCTEGNGNYADKSLAVWHVADITIF